jgi:hypothetical protein
MRCAQLALLVLALFALLTNAEARSVDTPDAPDYAQSSAWAAYPGRPSHADDAPVGVIRGIDRNVPVFFVHPTTFLAPVISNAAFDAGGEIGARVDDAVLRFQASVFNGCCRIFAPRYRQASLKAITSNTPDGYAAADLAYHDVERAFTEFLKLNSHGPFILASHSQGSIHGMRLLQERIIGTPLQNRLVAAYLIGVSLPAEGEHLGIPICGQSAATGCALTWNTVRRGHEDRRRLQDSVIWWQGRYQPVAGRPLVCVNPLDWKQDGQAEASANQGAIYGAGRQAPIPAPIPELTGAWCDDGLLGIEIPRTERRHFSDVLTLAGVYHDFDYSLFYMNVRANASERIEAWRRAH